MHKKVVSGELMPTLTSTLASIYQLDDGAGSSLEVKLDAAGNSYLTKGCYYCQHVVCTPTLEVDNRDVADYYEDAHTLFHLSDEEAVDLRNMMTAITMCKLFLALNIFVTYHAIVEYVTSRKTS